MRLTGALLKRMVLLHILFLFSSILLAQSGTIKGIVKGVSGERLNGASVILQGTSRGTTTNTDGEFSLTAAAGTHTLVASYVGHKSIRQTVTVRAGETSNLEVNLTEAGESQEVVVLGSRSTPRTQLETPVPVDVIDVKRLASDAPQ